MGMTKTQRHDDVTAPQAERRANSPSFRPAAFGRPFRVGFRAHLDFRNRVIAMAEDAKQLFSTEEWLSFPEIEKNRYENILRNYKMMKDLGEFCRSECPFGFAYFLITVFRGGRKCVRFPSKNKGTHRGEIHR